MSVSWNKVKQEVANILGAVTGTTSALADTNYSGTIADATLIGPDFTKTQIEDALAKTVVEIVKTIAETPLHPERQGFTDFTGSLPSGTAIPRLSVGGLPIIGLPGYVRDASDSTACLPVGVDRIRSYNRFAATVYNGFDTYWYCINGNRILHTRTAVVIEVCVFQRPTNFSLNLPIDDNHERGLVCGAVAILAPKEGMFMELQGSMQAEYLRHLAEIRAHADPNFYGLAQSAPSTAN